MAAPKIPNNVEENFSSFSALKAEYNYPDDINLHPDSDQHQRLLRKIMSAAQESYNTMQDRFDSWRELDQKLTTYIELDNEDRETLGDDKSKPVAMVVPISYATRETLLTYWTAAFMQSPLFRYEPSRDPKDTVGVLLLQNIIEQHSIRAKMGLDLYSHWSDSFTYGFGAVATTWGKKEGFRTVTQTESDSFLGVPFNKRTSRVREPVTLYEGNELMCLDPYNCLPDNNHPITKVQDMDYFGWVERTTFNKVLSEEKANPEDHYNALYLKALGDKKSSYFSGDDVNTGRYDKTGVSLQKFQNTEAKPTDRIHMYMSIIPEDFGLGDSIYPEIWKFTVAADRIILEATPLNLDHNQIPVCTMSPDSDGHSTLPVSMLEREYPIQHAIDWLWKARVTNIRKSLRNMLIADPSKINMNDLVDTSMGMVARLRPAAWGTTLKDAVDQLPVQDVTQGHLADIGFLMGVDERVFTSDQAKGVQNRSGERVSAQEARDTRVSFLSKMEKAGKIGAMQSHYDIAYQFAANTIQLMEEEEYVKLTGDYQNVLANEYGINTQFVKIEPSALDVRYDVIPQDGSIPGGEFADVWERLMNNAAAHPEVFNQLDFVRIWKHIARLLGAKNVDDFLKKAPTSRVASQEEIDKKVQQGNAVPISELENVI